MLLIEFETNLKLEFNILKYRSIDDDNWYFLYIDIETLNLLLLNFGIKSTWRIPTKKNTLDNGTTGEQINYIKLCGASIGLYCGNYKKGCNDSIMEQNY